MAEAEIPTTQSAGSASRFVSAMRLRMSELQGSKMTPLLLVLLIFLLALFLRSYYAYDLSASNDWLMSGGSDSYYYHRLMEHAVQTGEHLHIDPSLNFPDGARNPRPPFYTFSVAAPAVLFQGLFSSATDSLGFFFIMSSAFWGALTVIPIYFIAKEIFGRRAGYVAALFLAIIPSHVERSVATLCDHDPFALFFIVLTVYFLMKALKATDNSKLVENWLSPRSIARGLRAFFPKNDKAIMYALLAGLSFAAIAMAWVGFAYIEIILLAFFIIQILINKFKGIDSTALTLVMFIAFGFGFLLAYPVYHQMNLWNMDIPFYLFGAAIIVGVLFSVTRDLPWIVTLPLLALFLAIDLVVVIVINPALGNAIFSGMGYFGGSKVYDTIAEARAPVFSELAVSFGIVTFYLSFVGLILMLAKIPKRIAGDYIIVSVWMAVAVFMATSAGRFMFNAAPAFAIASAWVTLLIIDKLDFKNMGKLISGSSGTLLQVIRKSIKVRHVVGALFVVFLLIVPNAWFSLDAGIPRESKKAIDQSIYSTFPDFMRPNESDYSSRGNIWYLGSFTYSLPLPNFYFPALWSWFRQQDADTHPESARPAYVSWWDYGFEAIDAGDHPAVADNFQQGYQVGGDILLAHNESVAIGLMIGRILTSHMTGAQIPQPIFNALNSSGVDPLVVKDVILNASKYKKAVTSNPDKYGSATSDITATNIMWRYLGGLFSDIGIEREVSLYSSLCDITGTSIGYIGVDSRLLPKAVDDVGVFYAPVKLTDRTIDNDGNPSDYYVIRAIDQSGVDYALSEIPSTAVIVDYKFILSYKFYQTMLYRAYAGFSPQDIGKTNDGLPGYSGSTQQISPMPAWNLTHFMMVYRTAYYNPADDGSGVWRAISLEDAFTYNQEIQAGRMEGIVDASARTAYDAGSVMIRYYDGAVLSGTVTASNGDPAPGMQITVQDKYGIPHHMVYSGPDGKYSLILPPGEDTITVSSGTQDKQSLIASEKIYDFVVNVSEDMADRKNVDSDGDGRYDWQVEKNVIVPSGTLQGHVFWDMDSDGNYTDGTDVLIPNSTLIARNLLATDLNYTIDAADGNYAVEITTGNYDIDTIVNGIMTEAEFIGAMIPGALVTREITRTPAKIYGMVLYDDGSPASGAKIEIRADEDDLYPSYATTYTDDQGAYSFDQMLPGEYTVTASKDDYYMAFSRSALTIKTSMSKQTDFVLRAAGTLNIQVYRADGLPFENANVRVSNSYYPSDSTLVTADSLGVASLRVPEGTYSLVVESPSNNGIVAGAASTVVKRNANASALITVGLATTVSGLIESRKSTVTLPIAGATAIFSNGLVSHIATANADGFYSANLPAGDYEVVFYGDSQSATAQIAVASSPLVVNAVLDRTANLTALVWHDRNGDGTKQAKENVSFADVRIILPDGVTLKTRSGVSGEFSIPVPASTTVTLLIDAVGYSPSAAITFLTPASGAVSKTIELDLAPISVNGKLMTAGGSPLRNTLIEFINSTRSASIMSDSAGDISGEIYPGVYDVQVRSPIAAGSSAYYYVDARIAAYVGTDIYGLELEAEKRIKVDGDIAGVPASRTVRIQFEGPTLLLTEALGTYTAFLEEGSYVCYAYDTELKSSAAIFEFDLTPTANVIDVALSLAFEVSGRSTNNERVNNITLMQVTQSSSGMTFSKIVAATASYSVVLPSGNYDFYFEMHGFVDDRRTQRYLKLTNETTINVNSVTRLDPFLEYGLDNATLNVTIVDQNGVPVVTEVRFGGMDSLSQGESYMTGSNGEIRSSIHPGEYAIYVSDTPTGLSYFGYVKVVMGQLPVDLELKLSQGYTLKVSATASNATDLSTVQITVANLNNGAIIKSALAENTNIASLVVPDGRYAVEADGTRRENSKTITYTSSFVVNVSSDVILNAILVRDSTYALDATWDSAQRASIPPGGTVTYLIEITNNGNIMDTYNLSGSGSGFSFKVPPPVTVDFGTPGVSVQVPVTVIANADVNRDHGDIYIDVKSNGNPGLKKSVAILIDISPVYSVSSSPGSAGSVNGTTFFREVEVTNTGNIIDNYTLVITNVQELYTSGWNAALSGTGSLTGDLTDIGPGEMATINITFTPIRKIPDINITVAVTIESNSSTASTVALVEPLLPDLTFWEDRLDAQGDDIYSYDIFLARDSEDLILLAAMLSMVAAVFIMRKIKFGRFFR